MSPVISWASDGEPAVSYALADTTGRMLASRNPHTVYYSASTVKLGVMLAAVLAAERRVVLLESAVECRSVFTCRSTAGSRTYGAVETFRLDPDDRDPLFPADGSRATVAELVEMMIRRSSNEATNVLFDLLGADAVAEAFRLCGARSTRMERRIGDPCAVRDGLTNETTAADLVTIMRVILGGELTSSAHAEWMRHVLAGQQHRRIADVVPAGVPWGSKSGDVAGIEHDVAFVGNPGQRRFIAVCTRGYEPEQGREVIRAVAQALLPRTP
jgi:beta-lactamase class A